ncbi:hypothetical protein HQ49_10195 [Porphyromonas gulae]|uniref:Uncharacterized protein n=1 Tax=Porphyromonas gulae TaxID=111105 RepID=A0A099WSL2_9PORP|nr:hypothetical protein HQ49_10195 [Porphyromonas gulae]KGL55162.1 hypothetical protein HQ50_07395 [Porphyromonas sp. COT-052 OH4946]KGN87447.1 hypothetical protein HR08_01925 [Porphyromonas gulae]KGN90514.1 hypothetical protein HR15_03390 [Porphyromonas gulae]KKC51876.1 hypothetical protein HR10_01005 [Porphyromonas gulae]
MNSGIIWKATRVRPSKTDTAVEAYSSGTARDSHPIPSYTPLNLFETSRDHYDGNKDIVFYNNSKRTTRHFGLYMITISGQNEESPKWTSKTENKLIDNKIGNKAPFFSMKQLSFITSSNGIIKS